MGSGRISNCAPRRNPYHKCSPNKTRCPPEAASGCSDGFGPGAEVQVVVTYRVPVARLPFLGAVAGPGITIGATHHTRVDRYRGLGG
jgi:hypothetical protein